MNNYLCGKFYNFIFIIMMIFHISLIKHALSSQALIHTQDSISPQYKVMLTLQTVENDLRSVASSFPTIFFCYSSEGEGQEHYQNVKELVRKFKAAGFSDEKLMLDTMSNRPGSGTPLEQYIEKIKDPLTANRVIVIGSHSLKAKYQNRKLSSNPSYVAEEMAMLLGRMQTDKGRKGIIPIWFEGKFEDCFPDEFPNVPRRQLSPKDPQVFFKLLIDVLKCSPELSWTQSLIEKTQEKFDKEDIFQFSVENKRLSIKGSLQSSDSLNKIAFTNSNPSPNEKENTSIEKFTQNSGKFLPLPEMDVEDVLAARSFAEVVYSQDLKEGLTHTTHYKDQTWLIYPFRPLGSMSKQISVGAIFRNRNKIIISLGITDLINEWFIRSKIQQKPAECLGLKGYVHTGLCDAVEEIYPGLKTALLNAYKEVKAPCEHILTGYSTGGALAMLMVGKLYTDPSIFNYKLLPNQLKVINFSSPNTGNTSLCNRLEEIIQKYNIVQFSNECDLILYTLPSNFSWHSQTGIWICIKPLEHLTIKDHYFLEKWGMYEIKNKIIEIGGTAAIYKWLLSKGKGLNMITLGIQSLTTMHDLPSEKLIEKKFIEMLTQAKRLENYEDLPRIMERESTSNILKSIF